MKPIPSANLGPDWSAEHEYWFLHQSNEDCSDASVTHQTHQEHYMPNVSDMIESKYLKQSDVPDPLIVTVRKIGKINIAKEDEPAEHKWAVQFKEFNKPMLLNSTNIKLLEKACGSSNTDDWVGKEVIVYTDENVSYGGQIVGGLRIRRHQDAPTRKASTDSVKSLPDMDDDIPF